MSAKKGPDPVGHEEFVSLFEKGLSFTKEILAENERLRFRIASLEAEVDVGRRHGKEVDGDALVAALRRQVSELEAERTRLLSSFQEVETLNRDYMQRYAEIEAEHNNLADVYQSCRAVRTEDDTKVLFARYSAFLLATLSIEVDRLEHQITSAFPEFKYIDIEVL